MPGAEAYDGGYFSWQAGTADGSAAAMLPIALDLIPPVRSLVDIGCGVGMWAREAERLGIERVIGVDGGYAHDYVISRDSFVAADLTKPLPDLGRFDVAISLEVAEHLHPRRDKSFVRELCALAPIVLFSAAIPGQGGPQSGQFHLNERWQSYWSELFEAAGYHPVDLLRPLIWNDARIAWWYRQNAFLAVAPEVELDGPPVRDVVHPELWRQSSGTRWADTASPRALLRRLPAAVRRSLQR